MDVAAAVCLCVCVWRQLTTTPCLFCCSQEHEARMADAKMKHKTLAMQLRRVDNARADREQEKERCREMADADAESRRVDLDFRRTEFLRRQASTSKDTVAALEVRGGRGVGHVRSPRPDSRRRRLLSADSCPETAIRRSGGGVETPGGARGGPDARAHAPPGCGAEGAGGAGGVHTALRSRRLRLRGRRPEAGI